MLVLLFAASGLTYALGGSVKSWTLDSATYTNPPSTMIFLEGIKEAVIFGKIHDSVENYAYVTTMKASNKLSGYTTLKGVREIHSAIAHPTDDNIVLVAGVALSGDDAYDHAFVGALNVGGEGNLDWQMFSLVRGMNSSYDDRMSCIEVLPDSNMFVAAGYSYHPPAGKRNGMIFAAYDLDDFSQLYTMQHTAYYYSTNYVGAAFVRGMARIGSNHLVVANTGYGSYLYGNGLCRFNVSRDSMQLHWCRQFISDSYKDYSIAGVHVSEDSSILVTGYKSTGGYYYPFVRHFDMQGSYQYCDYWTYSSPNNSYSKSTYIHSSFYDSAKDWLYLGGSYVDDGNYDSSVVLVYSVSGRYLEDARAWDTATRIDDEVDFRPTAVRGIVKSDNGTLMFANAPELVTVTDMGCFEYYESRYTRQTDNSGDSTDAQTVYFGKYTYEQMSEGSNGMYYHSTSKTKTLCGENSGGNGSGGANVVAIVGGVIGGICGCLFLCALIAFLCKNNNKGNVAKASNSPATISATTATTTTSKGPLEGSSVTMTSVAVSATAPMSVASAAAVAAPMNAAPYASAPIAPYPYGTPQPGYGAPPPAFGGAMHGEGVTTGEQTEGYEGTREAATTH